jgi:hypothetical protein
MYNGYPSIFLPVSGIKMASSFHLELLEPPSSAVVGDGEAHAASKGNLLEKFKSHLAKMDEQPEDLSAFLAQWLETIRDTNSGSEQSMIPESSLRLHTHFNDDGTTTTDMDMML